MRKVGGTTDGEEVMSKWEQESTQLQRGGVQVQVGALREERSWQHTHHHRHAAGGRVEDTDGDEQQERWTGRMEDVRRMKCGETQKEKAGRKGWKYDARTRRLSFSTFAFPEGCRWRFSTWIQASGSSFGASLEASVAGRSDSWLEEAGSAESWGSADSSGVFFTGDEAERPQKHRAQTTFSTAFNITHLTVGSRLDTEVLKTRNLKPAEESESLNSVYDRYESRGRGKVYASVLFSLLLEQTRAADRSLWSWASDEGRTRDSWWAARSRSEGSPRSLAWGSASAPGRLYSEPCRPPAPPLCCSSAPGEAECVNTSTDTSSCQQAHSWSDWWWDITSMMRLMSMVRACTLWKLAMREMGRKPCASIFLLRKKSRSRLWRLK